MVARLIASRNAWRIALALSIWVVVAPWIYAFAISPSGVTGLVGADFNIYMDATRSWASSGDWYLARQLHGPYRIEYGDVLYPPLLLYLTIPFIVVPEPVWWLVPLGAVMWSLRRLGPLPWALPLMMICLVVPLTTEQFIKGNPVMWVMAIEAVCLARGWPTVLVLLKPSLVPFAFLGVRRWAWWLLLVGVGIACIPVLGPALAYPQVILDSRGGGLLYSIRDVPLLLIPILAATRPGPWRIVDARGRTLLGPIRAARSSRGR